jgi:lipopolysaccharide transport system ATP-binding protein
MYVRLAFAVAAHLEPEILIIDEVLAVGDAEFQKKCIGKIADVSGKQGRTVLFVSHNMAAVKTICNRGLVLEHGTVRLMDTAENAVSYYLKGGTETLNSKTFISEFQTAECRLNEISLCNIGRTIEEPLLETKEIELLTDIDITVDDPERYHVTYHLNDESGEPLFSFYSQNAGILKIGNNKLVCTFPAGFFNPGTFYLSIFIVKDKAKAIMHEKDILSFTVIDGERELGVYMGREPGYIKPSFNWTNR